MSEFVIFCFGIIVSALVYQMRRKNDAKNLMRDYAIWAWGKDCRDVMGATNRFLIERKIIKAETKRT